MLKSSQQTPQFIENLVELIWDYLVYVGNIMNGQQDKF